jgi:EAL domain-containing protein (putative c-di-GMP-specific phosphodiesterase class I)
MPLTDLIRYFNAADTSEESTMYLQGERVAAWHRGLQMTSLFQPIVDLRQESVVGHMALLSAQQEDETPVSSEVAYASCESAASLIYFDRLCRTLHALNLLAQRDKVGGFLQLAIEPRYLLAVPNQHGLVYEAILKRCGLAPEDIVLEFSAGHLGSDGRLAAAVSNFRQRGYRLALREPALSRDVAAVVALQPEFVRFDGKPDDEALAACLQAGIAIEVSGIDTTDDFAAARAAGISFGLGKLFGEAESDCRPTHSKQ